jgi:hypothetical protein
MARFQTKNTISSAFCRQDNQRFTVSMTGSVKVGQLDISLSTSGNKQGELMRIVHTDARDIYCTNSQGHSTCLDNVKY